MELLDDVVARIEEGLLGFDDGEGAFCRVAEQDGWWGEEAVDGEEEAIVGGAGRDDAYGAVVFDGEAFAGPLAVVIVGVDIGAALDVVEGGNQEMVFGGVHPLLKLCSSGSKDDSWLEVEGIFFGFLEVHREHGPLDEGLGRAGGSPVVVDGDEQLAVEQTIEAAFERESQFDGTGRFKEVGFALKGAHASFDDRYLVSLSIFENAGVVAVAVVFDAAAVDFASFLEGLTALPFAHGDGVTGLAHGSGTPVAADQQCVFVDPGDAVFACGQNEAAIDELAGFEIDFAHGDGIFAAVGEVQQAELLAGLEALNALADPALAVCFGECVVVDDGVPFWISGLVVFESGAADDSADMFGVAPGVVDVAGAEDREGEALGGIEDFEGFGPVGGPAGIFFDYVGGALILCLDPGQLLVAVDVFEPGVLVGLLDDGLLRRCKTGTVEEACGGQQREDGGSGRIPNCEGRDQGGDSFRGQAQFLWDRSKCLIFDLTVISRCESIQD